MKRIIKITFTVLVISLFITACAIPSWLLPDGSKTTSATGGATETGDTTIPSIDSADPAGTTDTEFTSDRSEASDGASAVTSGSGGTSTGSATVTGTTKTSAGSTTKSATKPPATATTTRTTGKPDTKKEFLGVWVSFNELDGMLKGKTVAQAKAAIDGIMANSKAYGLNAVIFHVRANSDAYYKSTVFNYAASVSNLIKAGFDPLAYAVQSAHSRGLELHAWVNPYRIGNSAGFAKCSDYFRSGGKYYYNPASSAAQKLILDGISEITRGYDVDGVQFDDYFYPADTVVIPTSGPAAFEKTAYNNYKSSGGKLGIADWRRQHVSALIASAHSKVHGTRPGCVFGVSPRGVLSQSYSDLYADVALWMKEKGYVDYICPQIYFGFLHSTRPFEKTLNDWIAMQRDSSVKLHIGFALHKIGIASDEFAGTTGRTEWATHDDIMKRSLQLVRAKPACGGVIFFSYKFFKPSVLSESGSWSKAVAIREVENLLAVI